jgi:hypothetical protein
MLSRLLALFLLAVTLAAAAEPAAPAALAPAAAGAGRKARLCGALVALDMARRRSRWLAG